MKVVITQDLSDIQFKKLSDLMKPKAETDLIEHFGIYLNAPIRSLWRCIKKSVTVVRS